MCPYGALLGILSLCSPLKITRNEEACIHCERCTKNCPAALPVGEKVRIKSPECTGCLTCVSYCPAKGALDMSSTKSRILNPLVFAVLIIGLFFGAIGMGEIADRWNSKVTYEEYKRIIPHTSPLKHP